MQDARFIRCLAQFLAGLCLLWSGACATLPDADSRLEKEVRQFSQRLRWGDWDAAAAFLAVEQRPLFLASWQEDRDLNLVDVQVKAIEAEESGSASVSYALEYFRLPSTVVRRHTLTQTWRYFSGGAMTSGRWEAQGAFLPPP